MESDIAEIIAGELKNDIRKLPYGLFHKSRVHLWDPSELDDELWYAWKLNIADHIKNIKINEIVKLLNLKYSYKGEYKGTHYFKLIKEKHVDYGPGGKGILLVFKPLNFLEETKWEET